MVSEMGDVAATAAEAQPPAPAPAPAVNRGPARETRRAAAMARLQGNLAAEVATPAADAAKSDPAASSPPPKADPPVEKPDPATERGLRAIEQARKKFLDEQNAAKAELEVQRAEIARLRKEAEGRLTSADELDKLDPDSFLDRMKHWDDARLTLFAREAHNRTAAGKADPRSQAAAQHARELVKGSAAQTELAELREYVKQLEEKLTGEFTRRDQASFAERWVDAAVKAIPADKPTFLSKLHANEPDTAKRELLAIGAELEKANDGEPPTHDEVIAEFEKRKRASLKSMGLDPDALLAPKSAAPAKPAQRTLDVTASNVTRPENAPKTRAERRDVAIANLRARQRATADQT
jgi:hypothetical protein